VGAGTTGGNGANGSIVIVPLASHPYKNFPSAI
jgi:hypothetical protein